MRHRYTCWTCYADAAHRCAMCDAWRCDAQECARPHRHPEPQSGPPRDAWLASRMDYVTWARETTEGRAWLAEDPARNAP